MYESAKRAADHAAKQARDFYARQSYDGAIKAFREAVKWAAVKDEQVKHLRKTLVAALNDQSEAYAEVERTRDAMTAAIAADLLPKEESASEEQEKAQAAEHEAYKHFKVEADARMARRMAYADEQSREDDTRL